MKQEKKIIQEEICYGISAGNNMTVIYMCRRRTLWKYQEPYNVWVGIALSHPFVIAAQSKSWNAHNPSASSGVLVQGSASAWNLQKPQISFMFLERDIYIWQFTVKNELTVGFWKM